MAWQERVDRGVAKAIAFLRRTQRPDGAWIPLWFGHQDAPNEENPVYGTARVVLALVDLRREQVDSGVLLGSAIKWLVTHQLEDGGWGSAPQGPASSEETAVAVEALAAVWATGAVDPSSLSAVRAALHRGADWLVHAVESGKWREPAPIGFYFAKLWYFERLYPMIFVTAALNRLLNAASTDSPFPAPATKPVAAD